MPGLPARDALREAAARLGSRAEARVLAAHVAGVALTRLDLLETLETADAERLARLVERRAAGEPLQWLTGVAPFRTIEVAVGPGVFIPRPETERLAGWALEWLARESRESRGRAPRVVELCAGSGAVSLALATEWPGLQQWAVERSSDALPYLRRNLAETAVTVVAGDMATALDCLDSRVDVVVANPPYVPEATWAELPADVRDADPKEALVAGPDGLDAIKVVAAVAARLLRPGGVVACEHDDTHGVTAPAIFRAAGFTDVADHQDLAGRPRFVTASQRPSAAPPGP